MNIRGLKSFITAARCGSFQKASDELFLSSTALINQINVLEEEIGCKLFIRSNKGVRLTESGRYFFEACGDIVNRFEDAVNSTYELSMKKSQPICIGISLTTSYGLHTYLSEKIMKMNTSKLTNPFIVKQISDDFPEFIKEIRNLGTGVDLIPYYLGNTFFSTYCSEFCIMRIPMYIAMSINHPFNDREIITYEDLNGQELITLSDTINDYYSMFNREILKHAPDIRLQYVNYIDIPILNKTASHKNLLLIGAAMRHIHPLLKYIPLATDFFLPYGFIYSQNPSLGVRQFLDSMIEQGISGKVEDSKIVWNELTA